MHLPSARKACPQRMVSTSSRAALLRSLLRVVGAARGRQDVSAGGKQVNALAIVGALACRRRRGSHAGRELRRVVRPKGCASNETLASVHGCRPKPACGHAGQRRWAGRRGGDACPAWRVALRQRPTPHPHTLAWRQPQPLVLHVGCPHRHGAGLARRAGVAGRHVLVACTHGRRRVRGAGARTMQQ